MLCEDIIIKKKKRSKF